MAFDAAPDRAAVAPVWAAEFRALAGGYDTPAWVSAPAVWSSVRPTVDVSGLLLTERDGLGARCREDLSHSDSPVWESRGLPERSPNTAPDQRSSDGKSSDLWRAVSHGAPARAPGMCATESGKSGKIASVKGQNYGGFSAEMGGNPCLKGENSR